MMPIWDYWDAKEYMLAQLYVDGVFDDPNEVNNDY